MASGKRQGWDGMRCDAMGKICVMTTPPIFLPCSYSLTRSLSQVIKFAGSQSLQEVINLALLRKQLSSRESR